MTGPRSSVFTSVRQAPRHRWRTLARATLILAALAVAAAIVTTVALWVYAGRRLQADPLVALGRPVGQAPEAAAAGTVETLVAAVDTGAVAAGEPVRVHTLAVVQTAPGRDRPVVLVVPTSLQAQVAGTGTMPFAAVLGNGGAEQLVEAVESYTGMELDHYVVADIAGVAAVAAAVGGVALCPDAPAPAGCAPADGADVAARLRAAAGTPAGALAQHRIAAHVLADVVSPATLLDPLAAKRAIDAVAAAAVTDVDLTTVDLVLLSWDHAAVDADAVDLRYVPSFRVAGEDVTHAYPEQAETLFQAMRDGTALPPDVGVAAPAELTTSDVTVVVLNGIGTAGLAADAAEHLARDGFTIVATDNAARFGQERTTVVHSPGAEVRARLVAERFPGAEVTAADAPLDHDGDTVDVIVTLGSDWAGS